MRAAPVHPCQSPVGSHYFPESRMSLRLALFALALALGACASGNPARQGAGASAAAGKPAPVRFQYPSAARGDTADEYHGTKVADPYRWMENLDTPEVKAWVEAENRLTQQYLADTPRE